MALVATEPMYAVVGAGARLPIARPSGKLEVTIRQAEKAHTEEGDPAHKQEIQDYLDFCHQARRAGRKAALERRATSVQGGGNHDWHKFRWPLGQSKGKSRFVCTECGMLEMKPTNNLSTSCPWAFTATTIQRRRHLITKVRKVARSKALREALGYLEKAKFGFHYFAIFGSSHFGEVRHKDGAHVPTVQARLPSTSSTAELRKQITVSTQGFTKQLISTGDQAAPTEFTAEHSLLRLATLNVQGLSIKAVKVFTLAKIYDVDILCIQEARLSLTSLPAMIKYARRRGYKYTAAGPPGLNDGRFLIDPIIFSKQPIVQLEVPEFAGNDRVVMAALHLPRAEPIVLANLHGYTPMAGTKAMLQHVFQHAAVLRRRLCCIGDWNMVPTEGCVAEVLLNCRLHLPETPAEIDKATHDKGRHLDYALFHRDLTVTHRGQAEGVADHDLVYYDLACYSQEEQYTYKSRAPLIGDEDITEDTWEEVYNQFAHLFDKAESHQDANAMWQLLSDHSESLLTHEVAKGRPRSASAKVVHFHGSSTKHVNDETNALAQLYKLRRVDLHTDFGKGILEEIIHNREQNDKLARLSSWNEDMTTNDSKTLAWLKRQRPDIPVQEVRESADEFIHLLPDANSAQGSPTQLLVDATGLGFAGGSIHELPQGQAEIQQNSWKHWPRRLRAPEMLALPSSGLRSTSPRRSIAAAWRVLYTYFDTRARQLACSMLCRAFTPRGLLHGCPASVILILCDMNLWIKYVGSLVYRKWDTLLLDVILARPERSSRALAIAVAGPQSSVEFQLDFDSLMHELRRLRRHHRGQPQARDLHPRWEEVLRQWGWKAKPPTTTATTSATDLEPLVSTYTTRDGDLDLTRVGKSTLLHIAWRAHLDQVWKMAKLGMTIVMVVHQPRYSLFTLIDDVLLLGKGGSTVYIGPTTEAKGYFERLGFIMPPNENAADWMMDMMSGQVEDHLTRIPKAELPEALFDAWERAPEAATVNRTPPRRGNSGSWTDEDHKVGEELIKHHIK
ncbi:unnamed protein product, partial [Prorocentrum cordatum]